MSDNPVYEKEEFISEYKDRDLNWYASTIANMKNLGLVGPALDLGCGLGYFVEACLLNDIQCSGIELSEYGVKMALKRNANMEIIKGDLTNRLPYDDSQFRSVVVNQVIDHLNYKNGVNLLQESYRVLSDEGRLFIYSGCRFNKKEAQDPEHLFLYTPKLLKNNL